MGRKIRKGGLFVKLVKHITAVFLALILALGVILIPAGAVETPKPQGLVDPGWAVDREHPVIIVHGIGQSEVFEYDDDDITKKLVDGEPVTGWPISIDTDGLIPKLIFPLLASLLLQNDIFLTKTIRGAVKDLIPTMKMTDEGRPVRNMRVEALHRFNGEDKDPTSLADLNDEAKAQAYKHIPMQDMTAIIGEQNMYYFAYDSFGNLGDIVDDLYGTIQDILDKHNTDKVNIVPISLGGTIMNGLVDYYKDEGIAAQLNNVVYVIAALDGSSMAGDLFTGKLAVDNENLYRNLIPSLVEGWTGYLINVVLRLFPKRLLMKVLDAVIESVLGDVVSNVTMLWALVPSKDYETAAEMWLDDKPEIKKQTDKYYKAQKNSQANVKALRAAGVNVYAIAEYNIKMYPFVPSAFTENSDVLLQLSSPSMGATYGYVDTPLPADYVPKKPGYMSTAIDGGIVDASTCALPDHTWFFKDQNHERTGRSDVVMGLTMRLSCSAEENLDVHTLKDTWPQFNHGREGRSLKENLAKYKNFDLSSIEDAADRTEFTAAYAALEAQTKATIIDPKVDNAVRERFDAILIKIGEKAAPEEPDFWEQAGEKVAWGLSEAFYYGYGPRGFIDPIWRIWCD